MGKRNLGGEVAWSIFSFLFYLFIVPATHNTGGKISLYVFAGCMFCHLLWFFMVWFWLVGSIDFVFVSVHCDSYRVYVFFLAF